MSDQVGETMIWHRTRDSFLPVLRAAHEFKEAHEAAYPGHLVWVDERGGIDFTMCCFKCVDDVKKYNGNYRYPTAAG
jgi:hypothetical protein